MAEPKETIRRCFCPYCDEEIMAANLSYCQACQVTIFYCPECQKPIPRETMVCTYCGTEIKG